MSSKSVIMPPWMGRLCENEVRNDVRRTSMTKVSESVIKRMLMRRPKVSESVIKSEILGRNP
jgi:hypothetical protein